MCNVKGWVRKPEESHVCFEMLRKHIVGLDFVWLRVGSTCSYIFD